MTRAAALHARLLDLRARLKSRADTEHEMTINRLVIVSIALAYLTVADSIGIAEATAALQYGKLLCISYFGASLLIFAHLLAFPELSHGRRIVALVLDMTTLSLGMHFGDSAFALGYPIYLWIIFGNGFRFGIRYLIASTAAAITGFVAVIATTPIWLRDIDLAIGLLIGLVILPAYVSVLIRRLSEAKRQAEAASQAKSLFLASVSHELRTPLNAIISLGDLLRDSKLSADQTEMARTIGSSGRSLLALINGILDLSRIEAGKHTARAAPFEPVGVVDQVRRVMQVQADAKGLTLTYWVGQGVPHRAVGPGGEFEQVLINLIGNAIKFTPEGTVAVSVEARPTRVGALELVCSIADTGIGIAPEAQARIFEAFSQADASIIDSFGGTGLGLAIVRQQLRLHGGDITVDSEPGRGSVFRFTLPISADETAANGLPEHDSSALPPVVVVSHNPALPAHVGLLSGRVSVARGARALEPAFAAAQSAEANGELAPRRPVVIIDLDTISDASFANTVATLDEMAFRGAVGLLSGDPLDAGHAAGLPFAIGLGFPPTRMEMARLADLHQVADDSGPKRPSRSLAILVAEDNLTNQGVIRRILERDGHAVTLVGNGEQAVETLEKRRFDLVLMDINMPVMNGLEATKLHRFASLGRPRTPIHALTADVTPDTRTRCLEAGMDGILHKPIEGRELVLVLAEIERRPAVGDVRVGLASAGAAKTAVVSEAAAPGDGRPCAGDDPVAALADIAETAVIDESALDVLFDLGGDGFVEELALQYLVDATRHAAELSDAVARLDSGAFRDLAHSLRSSSANIGAKRLFALCLAWRAATTEQLASDGHGWCRLLDATVDETRVAMTAMLDQRAARRLSA
jgi:two-component system sensor histidine kinase RpfC